MNIKLVIADSDSDYAQRLFDALSKDRRFTISLFTDKDAMQSAVSSKRYDMILMDRAMADSNVSKIPVAALMLDPDDTEGLGTLVTLRKINKYQRVSEIVRALMDMYAEAMPNVNMYSTRAAKVLVVYSPVGGAGKSTIAVSLGMALARAGQRSVYLDMEEHSSVEAFFGKVETKGLSEVFGKLGNDINFSAKLQSLLHTVDGMGYFNSFDNPRDIFDITPEDISKLLEIIDESGLCDVVIIDVGSSMTTLNRAILERADRIVLVAAGDPVSDCKMVALLEQPDFMDRFGDKLRQVLNSRVARYSMQRLPLTSVVERMNATTPLEVCRGIVERGYLNAAEYIG